MRIENYKSDFAVTVRIVPQGTPTPDKAVCVFTAGNHDREYTVVVTGGVCDADNAHYSGGLLSVAIEGLTLGRGRVVCETVVTRGGEDTGDVIDCDLLLCDLPSGVVGYPGIQRVQVVESEADNGKNIVTIYYSDGTSTSFAVRNGSKGDQGNSVMVSDNDEVVAHIINNLTDGGATSALSAEQGKLLKELVDEISNTLYGTNELTGTAVEGVEAQGDDPAHNWYITSSGVVSKALSAAGKPYYEVVEFEVEEGETYVITVEGKDGASDAGNRAWCVYDADFEEGTLLGVSTESSTGGCNSRITIPTGGTTLYVAHRINRGTRPNTTALSVREIGDALNNRVNDMETTLAQLSSLMTNNEFGFPILGMRPNAGGTSMVVDANYNCAEMLPYSSGLFYTGWSAGRMLWWYDAEKRCIGYTGISDIASTDYYKGSKKYVDALPFATALSLATTADLEAASGWRDEVAYVRAITYVRDPEGSSEDIYDHGTVTPKIEQKAIFVERTELETRLSAIEQEIARAGTTGGRIDLKPTEIGFYTTWGSIRQNPTDPPCAHTPLTSTEGMRWLWYCSRLGPGGLIVAFFDENGNLLNCGVPGTGDNSNLAWGVIDLTESRYASVAYVSVSIYNTNHGDTKYFRAVLGNSMLPERGIPNPLRVLIFGDSITDNTTITVGGGTEDGGETPIAHGAKTTAYLNKHLGETRVTGGCDKWAWYFEHAFPVIDLRNYAKSGASYKYSERGTAANERQNLSAQVTLALADATNPNGVFPTGDSSNPFYPDIVIFALGTNDQTSNDTPETAMAVTGSSLEDLIANLDSTKFCQSIRREYLRVRRAWPKALMLCSLPIQSASMWQSPVNGPLRTMAGYYSIPVIDSGAECGIVSDFENRGSQGEMLLDGLHPNANGHRVLARCVIAGVLRHYYADEGV